MVDYAVPPPPSEHRSVDIARVLRDAEFGRLRWLAEGRAPYDDLYNATAQLFELLERRGVRFVLVGGLALLQYVDGRNTSDIDLIVAVSDLEAVPEVEVTSRDGDFARGRFHGIQLDFLLTANALFEHVRAHYTTVREFNGRALPCATVEGLLLLKLYALPSLYRQGDFGRSNLYEADIAALMHAYHPEVGPLLDTLQAHLLPTDIEALGDILTDIQRRVARFGATSEPDDDPTLPPP